MAADQCAQQLQHRQYGRRRQAFAGVRCLPQRTVPRQLSVSEDELVSRNLWRWMPFYGTARRFRRSEQGVTLIEFALIFPIMLLLFIGLVEFGEAFSVNRKISNAASTVSDLISQERSVTNAELQ